MNWSRAVPITLLTCSLLFLAAGVPLALNCPWGGINCEPMDPPTASTIDGQMHDGSDFTDAFTSTSSQCVQLYDAWNSAVTDGRVYFTDELDGTGSHIGSGDGDGVILVDAKVFDPQWDELEPARTVIHDTAHDLGCTDQNDLAENWARYCVETPGTHPPPQENCPGMY